MRPAYIWLVTDSHWNSDFKGRRPESYGWDIISNCRKVIAVQDILIHMGDVIDKKESELSGLLAAIPGKTKILIRGNHDLKGNNWYMNKGFDFVCDQMVIGSVLLSHIPQQIFPVGVRINIHGHFHDNEWERIEKYEPQIAAFYDKKRHRLLAMEHTGYKPVRLDEFAA